MLSICIPGIYIPWKWKFLSCVWLSVTLHSPWNSPGQNTGVGSLSLLQRIFPTQGSNSGLLHYRQILYQLSYKGCPRILEWVAYPSSRGSSQPRNRTRVSCIAGRFFTNWVIREALIAGVGCHLLLPGDLPDPGIEPGSPALQADSLPLSHQGSPKCWSRLPFMSSRGPSRPRDWTWVSWIAGRFFTSEPRGKPYIYFMA